jgi:hypothetical protein
MLSAVLGFAAAATVVVLLPGFAARLATDPRRAAGR